MWGFRVLGDAQSILRHLAIGQKGLIGFDSELIYADDQDLSIEERQLKHNVILINELLLRKLARDLAEHGIPLIVVAVPTKRVFQGLVIRTMVTCRQKHVTRLASGLGFHLWKPSRHRPVGDFGDKTVTGNLKGMRKWQLRSQI